MQIYELEGQLEQLVSVLLAQEADSGTKIQALKDRVVSLEKDRSLFLEVLKDTHWEVALTQAKKIKQVCQ